MYNIVTSFNAYQQYIVQRNSKYITSQNSKYKKELN